MIGDWMCATLVVWACVVFSPMSGLAVVTTGSYLFQALSVFGGEESLQGVPGDFFGWNCLGFRPLFLTDESGGKSFFFFQIWECENKITRQQLSLMWGKAESKEMAWLFLTQSLYQLRKYRAYACNGWLHLRLQYQCFKSVLTEHLLISLLLQCLCK